MIRLETEKFMKLALELGHDNVVSNKGGPFGAIVVKDSKVIGKGRNVVTSTNDPTAHAEIQAIREACQHENSFQLLDCEIYTSCEPCPMCIGAIFWARVKAVYYASTKEEAAEVGFDDQFIYEQIALPEEERSIPMKRLDPPGSADPFKAWAASETKIHY